LKKIEQYWTPCNQAFDNQVTRNIDLAGDRAPLLFRQELQARIATEQFASEGRSERL